MNWKRVISGVLAAAMLSALPVQLLVSAEGTEAVGQADGWQELTTLESLDESNTFFYSKDDQTFEKITHPEKDVKTADGIVDYLGDGAVAVVTDPEDAAYNAGDRGQNYAWSAVGYGDWLYVGTCYAAIGNTLSLMKSSLGDEYDDKDVYIAYFREPDFIAFSKFVQLQKKDEIAAVRSLAHDTFIQGDKELVDDDSLFLYGLSTKLVNIIGSRQAKVANFSIAGK